MFLKVLVPSQKGLCIRWVMQTCHRTGKGMYTERRLGPTTIVKAGTEELIIVPWRWDRPADVLSRSHHIWWSREIATPETNGRGRVITTLTAEKRKRPPKTVCGPLGTIRGRTPHGHPTPPRNRENIWTKPPLGPNKWRVNDTVFITCEWN